MDLAQEYENYTIICERALSHVLNSIMDTQTAFEVNRNDESRKESIAEKEKIYPRFEIYSRIKSFESAKDKCRRKKMKPNIGNIKSFNDIAGIRIVTKYLDSIPIIFEAFKSGLRLSTEVIKDYINDPKENGYRSLHVFVKRDLFFNGVAYLIPVEIQIRTEEQNKWASDEHVILYKNENANVEQIEAFKRRAQRAYENDLELITLRDSCLG